MTKKTDELLNSEELKLLIKSIAKKFYNVESVDLYQSGYIGALKAIKNYDFTDFDSFRRSLRSLFSETER